jgi:hypothetical protein
MPAHEVRHRPRPAGPPARRPASALLAAAALAVLAPVVPIAPVVPVAQAQLPDPYTVPRGALRVAFDPQWMAYSELFDVSGTRIPFGAYFSADSLGSYLLPTLTDAEAAVRSITGDQGFRFNAGRFTTKLDADLRRFPFAFSFGLTDRLTLTATVPLVTSRVKSNAVRDTTTGDVGWNPASVQGQVGGLDSLTTLLGALESAAAQVEAGIASGSYGCPSAPTCDEARALVDRIRTLDANLRTLTGFDAITTSSGTPVPPFTPLATSSAGLAIRQAIADVSAALEALGEPGIAGTMPLPTSRLPANAVDTVLVDDQFGYLASPLDTAGTIKLSGLGDVELGLRYALAAGPTFRAVLGGLARLPTGKKQDSPDNLVDIAPADGQLDLAVSLDGAFEPGSRVGIWFSGGYTLQFGDNITRRIARADRPIVPASAISVVGRNLGDVARFSLHPALRLTPRFRVFVSASYYHKGTDRYTLNGASVPDLEALTAMTIWTFGGGIWYRMDENRRRQTLPIEAGFVYDQAVYGTGGTAPKSGRMTLSLRLFYHVWGSRPAPEPAATPTEPPK